MERGFRAWKRSFIILAHIFRAARNLAASSNMLLWDTKKNDTRPANSSTSSPASTAA